MGARVNNSEFKLKVSVIIPTWNRSDTVERAIFSALRQTYPVFEVLVCDDGSTDNTEEIVRAIDDARLKWIKGAHAGCPAVPRNRGIEASEGDLIAFLDSDDCWLPEKIEVQIAALQEKGFDAVCCNAYRDIGQKRLERLISWGGENITFSDLLSDNRVVCSSVLVRRVLFEKTGFFPEGENLRVGEDYSLWLRFTQFTKIIYLDEPFVLYKDDPKNSVRSQGPSAIRQKFRAFRDYFFWHFQINVISALMNLFKLFLYFSLFYIRFSMRQSFVFSYSFIRRYLCLINKNRQIEILNSSEKLIDGVNIGLEDAGPLISVLLPTYNSSAYLRQSIESILRQTYINFELIVVDDASDDGTSAILDDIDDSRIVRIAFSQNQGIVKALNAALMRAKGVYLARMDADDMAIPDRLRCQVGYLEEHPDVAIVGSWIRGFGSLRRSYIHAYPIDNGEIQAAQYFENPFAHPSVMIRHAVFDHLSELYCSDFPYVEDWELWGRLFEFGKAANIPAALVCYRVHPRSSNHRFSEVQEGAKRRLLERKYLNDGLPFRPEIILDKPRAEPQWLRDCYKYFEELFIHAEHNPKFNRMDFANVLQKQLSLRVRQMAWFGFYPAWFVYKHNFK